MGLKCNYCGKEITACVKPSRFKRQKNFYCNMDCRNVFIREKRLADGKRVKVKCFNCGKTFSCSKSKIERNKNHFCTRGCYNHYVENQIFVTCTCIGCGKSFITKRARSKTRLYCVKSCYNKNRNSTSKQTVNNYRRRALETYEPQCKICSYGIEAVLNVHHIDEDRKNNEIENLVVLCPTHHKEVHLGIIKI